MYSRTFTGCSFELETVVTSMYAGYFFGPEVTRVVATSDSFFLSKCGQVLRSAQTKLRDAGLTPIFDWFV